jgi:predicted dehydrogenase
MPDYSRRQFLETGSAAVLGAGLASSAAPAAGASSGSVAPNDQLRFGVIGCRSMGWANMNALREVSGVECTALADVDRNVLEDRGAELEAMSGARPTLYDDYRRLLEDDAVDFVVIATPNHWHCLQLVHAAQAGKHAYVEKPLARTIEECYVMERAVQKHGVTVQVGQWQRSGEHWAKAVDYLQSGALGNVRLVKAWAYLSDRIEPAADAGVPDGVDYNAWLGPAPDRPFNPNRFHYTWRYFWDYAGGLLTDWGAHMIDFALHGMGVEMPSSVAAMGGKFGYPDGASETPDTQQVLYEYDDFTMRWEHAYDIRNGGPYDRPHGVAYVGNNGTLVIDRGGWEVYPEAEDGSYRLEAIPPQDGSASLDAHVQNFVDAIREGAPLNCPIEVGANTAVNCHLGNVALRTGRRLDWDAATRSFANDEEARALATPTYRDPWTLPSV